MSHKRRHENPIMDLPNVPLSDHNMWYYPSHGHDSDEDDLPVGSKHGNWGCKTVRGARWVRRGKITPWGPGMEDWENEERARKRLKLLLPQDRRSPSPPTLPHLSRSPSPPLTSPYTPPTSVHLSYSSFVMDKSVTHTFRSKLLDELEQATNGLIEGEATLRNALGRLWQVMSEDPEERKEVSSTSTTTTTTTTTATAVGAVDEPVITKLEEDEEENEEEHTENSRRLARAPDLTPTTHKIFLYHTSGAPVAAAAAGGGGGGGNNGGGAGAGTGASEQPSGYDSSSHFSQPETQLDSLQKSLLMLRELQDNGREYVERLQEIRESLGDIRAQRNTIWDVVRGRAVKELQDAATAMSSRH